MVVASVVAEPADRVVGRVEAAEDGQRIVAAGARAGRAAARGSGLDRRIAPQQREPARSGRVATARSASR